MVFVYHRSNISDLFILQFVYFAAKFASCKHLLYFHQFNLFYKLGPHSVHINKFKCISEMNYKDIQTRIINNHVDCSQKMLRSIHYVSQRSKYGSPPSIYN